MPGKYSHSVVLADYSSRGIISLPPDQFSKYIESAPLTHKSSVTQLRLRGTQSAQAVRRKPSNRGNAWSSQSGQQHLIAGNPPVPPKDRLNLVADAELDDTNQFNPMRYSRYYDLLPNGSPVIGITAQVSQPELSTAYKRQQQIGLNIDSLPIIPKSSYQATQPGKDSEGGNRQNASASRGANVNGSSRKNFATITPSYPVQAPPIDQRMPHGHVDASNKVRNRPSALDVPPPVVMNSQGGISSPKVDPASLRKATAMSVPKEERSSRNEESRVSPEQISENLKAVQPRSTQKDASHDSNRPSTYSPRTPLLAEPDFDGFSDMDFSPTGYSGSPAGPTVHSRTSSLGATLPVQRPSSSDRPASRGQRLSDTKVMTTTLTVAAPNGDVNSPSQMTESSVKTSTRALRSDSSASSVSIPVSHVNVGIPKHSLEGSRKANQGAAKSDLQWRLPEISEDHGFSPSIFEDNEGHSDNLRLDEYDSRPTIGHISSGKDVLFDNSDAMSELSAALPPPITRFRDDEDEFNANMARLFGEGGDYAVNKKANQSIGRSATKKTKGFFSKFRSKNSLPVR